MRSESIRQKLRDGGLVYGVMAAEFFTPGFCQIAGNAGAEFIIFDMEHGGVGIDVLKAQIAFARGAGVAPVGPSTPSSAREIGNNRTGRRRYAEMRTGNSLIPWMKDENTRFGSPTTSILGRRSRISSQRIFNCISARFLPTQR
jgi:hypothetical protein